MQGTAPVFQHNALSKLRGPQASFVALSKTWSQAVHVLMMQSLADNVLALQHRYKDRIKAVIFSC